MILGIVGLGLIGGSIAKALNGQYEVYGFDTNEDVISRALNDGAISKGCTDLKDIILCDAVIFCTPPNITEKLINSLQYKKGAFVSDACGIKGFISNIREDIDFIGGHPMAGREVGGYENSLPSLFKGCNYILVKSNSTSTQCEEFFIQLAKDLGAKEIINTGKDRHDQLIGFTSQLPHAVAATIVRHPLYEECLNFEGGSMEDFTRIASLNENMWCELFLSNKDNLIGNLNFIKKEIETLVDLLQNEDENSLKEYLKQSRLCKEKHIYENRID